MPRSASMSRPMGAVGLSERAGHVWRDVYKWLCGRHSGFVYCSGDRMHPREALARSLIGLAGRCARGATRKGARYAPGEGPGY